MADPENYHSREAEEEEENEDHPFFWHSALEENRLFQNQMQTQEQQQASSSKQKSRSRIEKPTKMKQQTLTQMVTMQVPVQVPVLAPTPSSAPTLAQTTAEYEPDYLMRSAFVTALFFISENSQLMTLIDALDLQRPNNTSTPILRRILLNYIMTGYAGKGWYHRKKNK